MPRRSADPEEASWMIFRLIPRGVKGIRREQEKLTSLTDSKKKDSKKKKTALRSSASQNQPVAFD